mgnify:CR=1 FL=1
MWLELVNLYRQLHRRILAKDESERYTLFHIMMVKSLDEIECHLNANRYFYNDLSVSNRNQLGTWRKLVDPDYQIHIRLYANGRVTGHYEAATHHGTDHLRGVGYRPLNKEEIGDLARIFDELGL